MRVTAVALVLGLAVANTAFAGPQSTVGGKPLESDTVHNVGIGWPGLFYEWWNRGRGKLDWALGVELLYGDWSGVYSDVSIGLALNAPLRWHIHNRRRPKATIDMGLRFTPGLMVGSSEGPRFRGPGPFEPGDRRAMGGVRAEIALPVSIDVHDRVSVVTGGSIPLTMFFAESVDPWGVIPLLFRMGVEINASPRVAPFFLLELGPGIGVGNGGADVDLAFRVWVGTSFWSVLRR
ncbi:MAG: hypothetical protein WBG86_01930 [Polyangiales bacterium]